MSGSTSKNATVGTGTITAALKFDITLIDADWIKRTTQLVYERICCKWAQDKCCCLARTICNGLVQSLLKRNQIRVSFRIRIGRASALRFYTPTRGGHASTGIEWDASVLAGLRRQNAAGSACLHQNAVANFGGGGIIAQDDVGRVSISIIVDSVAQEGVRADKDDAIGCIVDIILKA